MNIKKISVIIPCYKNEKTIQSQLLSTIKILEKTKIPFEIIVVIDGEFDNTSIQVKKVKSRKIKVFVLKKNRGKGYAFKFGFSKSSGDTIILFDGGNDINPSGLISIIKHFEWYNADIVIGSKLHSASVVYYPKIRKILSFGYYLIVKALFRLKVRDTQTGLKIYKAVVLKKVLPFCKVNRFAFDIEVLALANKFGFKRIYEAPVDINIDFKKSSSIQLFSNKGVWGILFDTIFVWLRIIKL